MYPFLGCVSQPGIDNGKCGNCAWHGTECHGSATLGGGGFSSGPYGQGDLACYNVTDEDWIRPGKAAAVAAQEQQYKDGHRQGRM
jgi:hypothetical protein